MTHDQQGCSTCQAGQEQIEKFQALHGRQIREFVQYDYRTPDGRLFSCVAGTVQHAREQRDRWLRKNQLERVCECGHVERWHDNEDAHCDKCACPNFHAQTIEDDEEVA